MRIGGCEAYTFSCKRWMMRHAEPESLLADDPPSTTFCISKKDGSGSSFSFLFRSNCLRFLSYGLVRPPLVTTVPGPFSSECLQGRTIGRLGVAAPSVPGYASPRLHHRTEAPDSGSDSEAP